MLTTAPSNSYLAIIDHPHLGTVDDGCDFQLGQLTWTRSNVVKVNLITIKMSRLNLPRLRSGDVVRSVENASVSDQFYISSQCQFLASKIDEITISAAIKRTRSRMQFISGSNTLKTNHYHLLLSVFSRWQNYSSQQPLL